MPSYSRTWGQEQGKELPAPAIKDLLQMISTYNNHDWKLIVPGWANGMPYATSAHEDPIGIHLMDVDTEALNS